MKKETRFKFRRKRMRQKVKEWGLILLTFSLTFLSLKASFHFYVALFDKETALLSSALVEVLRLATLFTMLRQKGAKKVALVAIYSAIILLSSSVSITSWLSEIIEVHDLYQAELIQAYQVQIDRIKAIYSEQKNIQLAKLDKDIYWSDSRLARTPNSTYWIMRREQLVNMKKDLLCEIDNFLSESPVDPRPWIEKNAAKLGIKVDHVQINEGQYKTIEKAIINFWGVNAVDAKKIVSIAYTLLVEVAILLLAVMTGLGDKNDRGVTDNDSIMTYLREKYPEGDINMFILKCRDRYQEKGDLPKASELTVKLRPIREVILNNGFSDRDIKEFFQVQNPVSRN